MVVAIAWEGLEEAISLVGGPQGALAGLSVMDCTNAVDYGSGVLQTTDSAAEAVGRGLAGPGW